jgi:pimeloyl-ACP methyl ester carboxylesterase
MNKTRAVIISLAILLSLLIAALAVGYVYLTHEVAGSFFDSGGVRIRYTDEGTGEPVVLVHGFAVNADLNWRRPGILQSLAKEYRVIALDLRGHGLSDKPHEENKYGFEMALDVIRLMDHLKIKKAHLVGYSFGGFIALKLAATHPERFFTVSPCAAGWEKPEESQFFAALGKMAQDLRAGRSVGPVISTFGGNRGKPGMLHEIWVRILTGYLNDSQALAALLGNLRGFGLSEKEVRGIEVPMLGIVGSRDPLLLGARNLVGFAPNYKLVIVEGADHIKTPMHDDMINTLQEFLRSHSD